MSFPREYIQGLQPWVERVRFAFFFLNLKIAYPSMFDAGILRKIVVVSGWQIRMQKSTAPLVD